MALELQLRQATTIPLEVDAVRLETVRTQSLDDIRRTRIAHGNRSESLDDFFRVSGSAAEDDLLVWTGDCSKVKWIGAGLNTGRVRVEGPAGMHLGAEMRGGEIQVHGDASDWAGAEMRGGRIEIQGSAGNQAGAAYRGSRRGMRGGELLIRGNAGDELGHSMRRGLIAVGGRAGEAVGFSLLAGSIFVFGEAGRRPGAGMRRGTIYLGGRRTGASHMLPTFRRTCAHRPAFLDVYLKQLAQWGFEGAAFAGRVERFAGDMLELGKGEILVPEAAGP